MIGFLKKSKKTAEEHPPKQETLPSAVAETTKKPGFFTRLKNSLQRTRHNFADGLANLILGKKVIDLNLIDDIEAILLGADIGVAATEKIITDLTEQISRKQLNDPQALLQHLQNLLRNLVAACEKPLLIPQQIKPFVILMVGVNGAGKTTTIGKLAKQLQTQGKKVMLAAGDTFRAAAVEQLQIWGERNHIPVVAQQTGADSASVVFDALQAAQARNIDVLIADTAGRLHTQDNLMAELKKIKRVLGKNDATIPHEVMLVLDASIGQNALSQAQQFNEAVGVTGIALTKLDGTAKGGIMFAIAQSLELPIRYIGVGESIDDLRPFVANDFVAALFNEETNEQNADH